MKISKVVLVGLLVAFLAGCSCKTKNIGPDATNIGDGTEGGPLKDINFGFDSYKLDSKAKGILTSNADWLKANPETKVQLEGHCDERGTNEYNVALGQNRARSAQEYLKSLGIPAARTGTVSYGEEMPLDPAHNEAAWAANRRVHHNVSK